MKRLISMLVSLGIILLGGYYGYRYFFDPEGISVAASEFCIINGSTEELVFAGETKPGAKMIQLLGTGEGFCVPAPVAGPAGLIQVGMAEDEYVCDFSSERIGPAIRLEKFDASGNCVWGE